MQQSASCCSQAMQQSGAAAISNVEYGHAVYMLQHNAQTLVNWIQVETICRPLVHHQQQLSVVSRGSKMPCWHKYGALAYCPPELVLEFDRKLPVFSVQHRIYAALTICYRPSVYLSVCPSMVKLGSCNFHHTVAQSLEFLWCKFNPEILMGSPWAGASNKGGVGKPSYFLALSVDI